MNKIYTFFFLLVLFISKGESQCVITCNQNVGIFSNNDPNTIGYDNMTSSFHSSIASEELGFRVWGERMLSNGTGHALSPIYINSTNYPGLTGTVYFAGLGSNSISTVQLIVLTSTGLFASGTPGAVLSTAIKNTTAFSKLTVSGKTDGLPFGITPDSVKMMFVSFQTIIITTCGGSVFVLSQNSNVRGDLGFGNTLQWSQVVMSNGQPLSGIIAVRGNSAFAFALKNDNTLWTWGNQIRLGNGTNPFNSSAAISMTLPTGVSKIKMIQGTSLSGLNQSYYVLDTNNKVYALGRNNNGQLADNSIVDKNVWVNCLYNNGTIINDAKWITSNEHDPLYPNIGIINTNSKMRTAGTNSRWMIGRTTNTGTNNLDFPTGISSTDTIYFCEVGGHTSAFIKKNTPRYGYVGHHVNGSIGNNSAIDNEITSVNFIIPPIISICGTVCDTPIITKKPFNCNDSIATFIIKGRRNNIVRFNLNGVNDSVIIGNNDTAIISRIKPNGDLALKITQVNSVYCNLSLEIKDTLKLNSSKDSFLTICSNKSVTFKQQTINTSGIYRDTLTNVFGCDSFFTLFLTVNNSSTKDSFLTICEPSSIIFNGKTINTSGIFKDTFVNSLGCDSILTLNLTVNPKVSTTINQSICNGQSFLGKTSSGTYIDTFKNGSSKGCDSIRTLILTVNSKTFSTINQTICQGNSFLGKTISGTYIDTLIGANSKGCDSIRTLNLTVLPTSNSIFYQSICLGDTFMGRTTSGIYIDTFKNGNSKGCDSIRTLNLTVNHTQKPGISINPNPNCSNKNTTISAVTPTGNYIYIWTVPSSLGAPGNVPSFTTSTPGTYKLSVKTKKSILCNTDFENNQIITGTSFSITNQNNVPCWQTTAGDSMIEVWSNGFSGVPAFSGNQFVELNANMVSSLFQNFVANSGNQIEISFAHRGRTGTDVMSVEIGKVGGPFVNLGNFSATSTAWVYNTLIYTIPNTIADTNFTLRFTSVSAAGGATVGNFLDAIDIKLISCKSEDTTVQLIINPTTNATINQTICQGTSFLFNGINRTVSGTYLDTLVNAKGCDSFLTLNLTVNPKTFGTINQSICQGNSLLFNGINRTVSGAYLDTLVNAKGCDSILTLNLTVNPKTFGSFSQTICEGSSFLFNGVNRTVSGAYLDTLVNSKGCDSILNLNLTVNPKTFGSFSQTICEGSSFLFNGVNRTVSGAYLDTIVNAKGCDSILTLNLIVNPKTFGTINQTICQGNSFLFNGINRTVSGAYLDTLVNAKGCDSILTLNLTVNPKTFSTINQTICEGSSFLGRTTSGTYTDTLVGANSKGCDSIRTLILTVNPKTFGTINQTICQGNSFLFNGINRTVSGAYLDTLVNAKGCDSILTLNLTVNPKTFGSFSQTICEGSSFLFNNISRTVSGAYLDTLVNAKGCDSILTLNLTVNPKTFGSFSQTICEGSSFLFNGVNRTVSGAYLDTIVNAKGCDSILTLNLIVNPKTFGTINQTICQGNSFLFNGIQRTVSGTYLDTLVNAKGCDSILTLNLTINPKTFSTINQTICEGSSFLGRTTSGTYIDTLLGANSKGCDSIRTLVLTVNPKTFGTINQTICQGNSFLFNGINRTVSGSYLDTLVNAKGCDSILTLILTVNPKTFGSFSQTICEGSSFLFNGINRTVSGTYLDTLINAKGCDSILTLNLTVNPKTFGSFSQTICEGNSFLFNGIQRTVSGTYLDTLVNAKGCDSILTLNLTVNPKTFGTINQTICQGNSFLFNGIQRTVSGTYLDTLVNAKGCDSILTLNLTINPKTFSTINQTICEGSSFLGRTTSGTYIDTLLGANSKGCDSIRTLILTVNPKTFGTINQTICQGNSFLFNGNNRTVSGAYLDTLVNAKGCDSILTLNLTVNPKTFGSVSQTICEGNSFLFNGINRTLSGAYLDTLVNAKGCDSILTLNLTVNPKTFGTINQTICEGNSFLFNGVNRTVSGAYLDTLVNAKGCDSILTLNLTVNPKTFGTINQTICQGNSFLFNGINRTISGVYLDTLVNAKGCDSILTLNLTVNPKTTSTINQTICEGSSFLGRTTSGTYTDTLVGANSKGCDSIRTLVLTVNPKTFGIINQTICQGNSFLFNGNNRTVSGAYLDTLVNAKGCDSILTLNLTVNPKTFGSVSQTICEGSSFLFNGINRTVSGAYLDTLVNAKGCDSILTLNLTVNPKTFGSFSQTICEGSSFLFNGVNRTVSGAYLDTLVNAKGCDSILTLNLTVNPKTFGTINQTICQSNSFLFNGINRSISGAYLDTLVNAKGCDSILTLNLTVNPKTTSTINQTICEGNSFLGRTIPGTYTDTLVGANAKGCDSIRTLILTVNPKTFGTINQTICQGSSFLGRTTSGTYTDTLVGANSKGCDSIRTLNLIVNPKTFGTINQTICEGSSFLGRTISGTYIDTLIGANAKGCDSIRTLHLIVNPKTFGTINQTICQGSSFLFNEINRTISGTYLDTLVNAKGCDSFLTLNLTVNLKTFDTINQTICEGDSFLFNGIKRTISGLYNDTLVNSKGCDSILTLRLKVNLTTFSTVNQTICQGQIFLARMSSGTFSDTLVGSNGCDSIRTLVLTVIPKTFSTFKETICEGESFFNRTKTGIYHDTLVNANGCDSIRTLNLTVNPTSRTIINKTICLGDEFLEKSTTGKHLDTFTNQFGCDSIREINLIVLSPIRTLLNYEICQGENFRGHTKTGIYIDTFKNTLGCDSIIETLDLFVRPNIDSSFKIRICEGTSYRGKTTAGKYVDSFQNNFGCKSIYRYELSFNPKTYSFETKSICFNQKYKGHTKTGIYKDTLINQYGCDSIITLTLTVKSDFITKKLKDTTINEGDTILLQAQKGFLLYTWSTMETSSEIEIHEKGNYKVTIMNHDGCIGYDSCNIYIIPKDTTGNDTTSIDSFDGYAECPNVFTPNDDFKNDLFKPDFHGRVEVVRLLVYTRLGEKVYEGHGNFSAWDGVYKGEKCEPGVYVYFIEYNNNKGKHFAKGSVTLIR